MENYSLRQAGFTKISDENYRPIYMLFEKGGNFDMAKFGDMVLEKQKNNEINFKSYERTDGEIELVYFNFDE